MKRNFEEWFKNLKNNIANFSYFVDYDKVYKNVDDINVELNILNSLIGREDIEVRFKEIVGKYPEVVKCIPILIAVRNQQIELNEKGKEITLDFSKEIEDIDFYIESIRKLGLFNLISKRLISNLVDYVTGVEVGLDSNSRKNRTGHLMEGLVESFIVKEGLRKDLDYYKELTTSEIKTRWNIELEQLTNNNKVEKRFDFVIKTKTKVIAIETNFYKTSGSKLNEVARSYKKIAEAVKKINNFEFVWITDGKGWSNVKNNLQETFESMEHLYNINDLENGKLKEVINEGN